MSKGGHMCVDYYNYRVEFQLRGAGHIHGVLWLDLDQFIGNQTDIENGSNPFTDLKNVFKCVNGEENPSQAFCLALQNYADMFISCSLKTPGGRIASEVNRHHHTRTCRKRGTTCRFNFPRFPSFKTVLSIPVRIKFPDPEIRALILEKSKLVLSKIKQVLEDDEVMKDLGSMFQEEIDQYLSDLDHSDNAQEENLLITSASSTIENWRKQRIIALLKVADVATILEIDTTLSPSQYEEELLDSYTEILSISSKGYCIMNKRDIDEIYINNYNEEWIRCWDSNMDIQLTLDYFAIITYITDYYMKDDSGTMEFIKAAIKDSENEPLREKLKVVKNTFLTHRQMGESEAYYQLFPSMHLADSNIGTVFVATGFNKSRFLKKLTKDDFGKTDKCRLINLDNNEDIFYIESPSLMDKYLRRPKELEAITLAQFSIRYFSVKLNTDKSEDVEKVDLAHLENSEPIASDDNGINLNFIISHIAEERKALPHLIRLDGESLPGESNFMKLRRPIALRYHKFKPTTEPHEFYFSELELFHPFRKDSEFFPDNFDKCEEKFLQNQSSIQYIKCRVMEYLQLVEDSRAQAEELISEVVADELDDQKEQDEEDCRQEGFEDLDTFVVQDPNFAVTNDSSEIHSSEGVFKKK